MEIERKYLVHSELWKSLPKPSPIAIAQGYMLSEKGKTIRIRIKGFQGFITIKGESKGISRPEYEYEIPLEDAKELLRNFCKNVIEKERYEISVADHLWEVDVFHGKNEGLIVAEVELEQEDERPEIPAWVKEEVSHDVRYFNSQLAKHPFCEWK